MLYLFTSTAARELGPRTVVERRERHILMFKEQLNLGREPFVSQRVVVRRPTFGLFGREFDFLSARFTIDDRKARLGTTIFFLLEE